GLYISNGENYTTVPSQSFPRTTWMTVERGHNFQHTFRVTFHRTDSAAGAGLVSAGANSVAVNVLPTPRHDMVRVVFSFRRPGHTVYDEFGITPYVVSGSTHVVQVVTDPAKHLVQVSLDGIPYLAGDLITSKPIDADVAEGATAG